MRRHRSTAAAGFITANTARWNDRAPRVHH